MSSSPSIAIVTGASRGLGSVVARVLASRGYDLVIGARAERALAETAVALRAAGTRVVTVPGDVAHPRVRAWLVEEARRLGGLHVLVNNASELGGLRPVGALDPARFERVLQVNVIAPAALIALALPMLRRAGGLIINVSSDAARGGYPGWGPYGASKAALDLLTQSLAAEMEGRGVSAVAVDPGDMRTTMHQEAYPTEDISDRPLPEITSPFWTWLFDQEPDSVNGQRFVAQQEDVRWLQRA
ncbi:MAG TPA: SDR family NAD(P)-dependent oxidoreductase [Vicinamibacterales bacterium]|nr:SDR family NAD(P)-dependent oxidoreductase [Vicinamibacterales bacterium]